VLHRRKWNHQIEALLGERNEPEAARDSRIPRRHADIACADRDGLRDLQMSCRLDARGTTFARDSGLLQMLVEETPGSRAFLSCHETQTTARQIAGTLHALGIAGRRHETGLPTGECDEHDRRAARVPTYGFDVRVTGAPVDEMHPRDVYMGLRERLESRGAGPREPEESAGARA